MHFLKSAGAVLLAAGTFAVATDTASARQANQDRNTKSGQLDRNTKSAQPNFSIQSLEYDLYKEMGQNVLLGGLDSYLTDGDQVVGKLTAESHTLVENNSCNNFGRQGSLGNYAYYIFMDTKRQTTYPCPNQDAGKTTEPMSGAIGFCNSLDSAGPESSKVLKTCEAFNLRPDIALIGNKVATATGVSLNQYGPANKMILSGGNAFVKPNDPKSFGVPYMNEAELFYPKDKNGRQLKEIVLKGVHGRIVKVIKEWY
jgi:hypothetical protein